MATRFVPIDRDTPLLLPPNLRDWCPPITWFTSSWMGVGLKLALAG